MYRSVTMRAVVPVAVAITGFVIICCVILYAIIKGDLTRGAFNQEQYLAATVIKSARYTMLKDDREGLGNIVCNVGAGVEHLRILNNQGKITFSSQGGGTAPPLAAPGDRAAKAARSAVLAISVPIYNEPACYTAPCHVHSEKQRELGVLDIGISTLPLQQNLSLMRTRMVVFCIMILCLTIGGVAALLSRSVFTPIRKLTEYSAKLASGEAAEPPRISGELGELAVNLERIGHQLENSRGAQGGAGAYGSK